MKKYKLIKEYPGSPELGTIAEKNSIDGIAYTYAGKTIYEASSESGLFQKIISTQPEFWQEIVEKNYEILSYIQIISNRVYKKDKNGIFISDNMWSLSAPLESHSNIKIHSVKRLLDGEIFTIGDIVTERMSDKTNVTIKRFNIHLDKLIIEVSKKSLNTTVDLMFLNKVKQPLFTTEDGVDIYDGDSYCSISKIYFEVNSIYKKAEEKYRNSYQLNRFLFFSTKEKAEEYIIMNKPCLSINDVLNSQDDTYFLENKLKELVNKKLGK